MTEQDYLDQQAFRLGRRQVTSAEYRAWLAEMEQWRATDEMQEREREYQRRKRRQGRQR